MKRTTTRRPDWARTHHSKPTRPNGRRERQAQRQLRLADPPEAGWQFVGVTR